MSQRKLDIKDKYRHDFPHYLRVSTGIQASDVEWEYRISETRGIRISFVGREQGQSGFFKGIFIEIIHEISPFGQKDGELGNELGFHTEYLGQQYELIDRKTFEKEALPLHLSLQQLSDQLHDIKELDKVESRGYK